MGRGRNTSRNVFCRNRSRCCKTSMNVTSCASVFHERPCSARIVLNGDAIAEADALHAPFQGTIPPTHGSTAAVVIRPRRERFVVEGGIQQHDVIGRTIPPSAASRSWRAISARGLQVSSRSSTPRPTNRSGANAVTSFKSSRK